MKGRQMKQTNPWDDAMGLKNMIQWFLAMSRTPVCVNVVLPFMCVNTPILHEFHIHKSKNPFKVENFMNSV